MLSDHFALAGDVAVGTTGNVAATGQSLTLVIYQVGPCVLLPIRRLTRSARCW